jgi:hypothetical protein
MSRTCGSMTGARAMSFATLRAGVDRGAWTFA